MAMQPKENGVAVIQKFILLQPTVAKLTGCPSGGNWAIRTSIANTTLSEKSLDHSVELCQDHKAKTLQDCFRSNLPDLKTDSSWPSGSLGFDPLDYKFRSVL